MSRYKLKIGDGVHGWNELPYIVQPNIVTLTTSSVSIGAETTPTTYIFNDSISSLSISVTSVSPVESTVNFSVSTSASSFSITTAGTNVKCIGDLSYEPGESGSITVIGGYIISNKSGRGISIKPIASISEVEGKAADGDIYMLTAASSYSIGGKTISLTPGLVTCRIAGGRTYWLQSGAITKMDAETASALVDIYKPASNEIVLIDDETMFKTSNLKMTPIEGTDVDGYPTYSIQFTTDKDPVGLTTPNLIEGTKLVAEAIKKIMIEYV